LGHVIADVPRTVRTGIRTCVRSDVLRRIAVLCGVSSENHSRPAAHHVAVKEGTELFLVDEDGQPVSD
jgi:hypothetical protein